MSRTARADDRGQPDRPGLLRAATAAVVDNALAVVEAVASLGGDALAALPHPVPSAVRGLLDALQRLADQVPPVASELDVVVQEVHAKRLSVQALQAELAALDRQLDVLEQALAPVEGWMHQWERLRGSVAEALSAAR